MADRQLVQSASPDNIRGATWVLSSVGSERRPYKAEVEGSNPSAPTNNFLVYGDVVETEVIPM